jgi:riboflavin synthase alpha subunit
MFTGIIQTMGTVKRRKAGRSGVTFAVDGGALAGGLEPGDSVSINGACHTVERLDGSVFEVTSVGETLRVTTMGELRVGSRVNLEPSARADTALGGHIVQGHVDGVGRVVSFAQVGEDRLLTLDLPGEVDSVVVDKGSVAVDGVSLTVVERLPGKRITITIIPFTLEHTVIGAYRAGTRVNLEADIIGKYVLEYVRRLQPESA